MTPTEHHHHTAEEMHNADVAHEHSDVDVRTIVSFGVGMVVVTVAAAIAMWGLFRVFESQAQARDPEQSPVARPGGELPPLPRLQTNEPAVLQKQRETEAKTLESYGWVDEKAGVARIPIAEAKKKLIEHGIASRTDPAPASEGTHAPAMAEATGGRSIK